jgi:hypothetical protein
VQVDSIKPELMHAWFHHLKLICDEPLSKVAFNLNLRRYTMNDAVNKTGSSKLGRGLHSSTSQLTLSRFGR